MCHDAGMTASSAVPVRVVAGLGRRRCRGVAVESGWVPIARLSPLYYRGYSRLVRIAGNNNMEKELAVDVPGSWRGVRKKLHEAPDEVQEYFKPAAELVERYPWEVSLSYLFARVERAHLMAIYCGVVKLHKANATLARKAVDLFHNTREEFQVIFANVFGLKIPRRLQTTLEGAQNVRDRVLHGKTVTEADYRMAIAAIIEYAAKFNDVCYGKGGFRPFGDLRGYKGAGASLDVSTSRWVLKGIGLPLK